MKNRHAIRRGEVLAFGAAVLLTAVLGFLGFAESASSRGAITVTDRLYRTIQLFILWDGELGGSSVRLDVARWLAVLVAGWATLRALALIFSAGLHRFRAGRSSKHIVVCGGEGAGVLLVVDCCKAGDRVVFVVDDRGGRPARRAMEAGAFVIEGDPTTPEVLSAAGVPKAEHLVAVTDDDGTNAEIVIQARDLQRGRGSGVLHAVAHLRDPRLCRLLQGRVVEVGRRNEIRVGIFDVSALGALSLLDRYPPFEPRASAQERGPSTDSEVLAEPRTDPHVAIVGFGPLGEAVLRLCAGRWTSSERLRVTVLGPGAETGWSRLAERLSGIQSKLDVVVCELEGTVIAPGGPVESALLADDLPVSRVYVCLEDDATALAVGMSLTRCGGGLPCSVVVCQAHERGLTALIRDEGDDFRDVQAFGLLERTCTREVVLRGTDEILARAVHEEYLAAPVQETTAVADPRTLVPWDQLPDSLKESNRAQAEDIGRKLEAAGCGVAPLDGWGDESFQFTDEQLELLAQMEHRRWMDERRAAGWSQGVEKDVASKITPHLVPYDQLTEQMKELDRNAVRKIPGVLSRVGLGAYRKDSRNVGAACEEE